MIFIDICYELLLVFIIFKIFWEKVLMNFFGKKFVKVNMGVLWLNFRCFLFEVELECKIMWRNLFVYLLNDSIILYMFNFVDIIFDMESLFVVLFMLYCLYRKFFDWVLRN